jgi:Recombination endonuclease VII
MKNPSTATGVYRNKRCIKCERDWQLTHGRKPESKQKKRAYHLLTRYGLTEETFDAMLTQQGGKCAICRKPFGKIFTDHSHATGKVRGLLCGPCNMYIGHVLEAPEVLTRAIEYLLNPQIVKP